MRETLFTDYAKYYDILYQDRDAAGQVEFVLDHFEQSGRRKTDRVLILGCGTGAHSPYFLEADFDVLGIDKHKPMLEIARERSDATFRSGTLPDVELQGSYDIIFLPGNVVNYLTAEELEETIDLVDSHLTDTGVLVFDYGTVFDVKFQTPPWLRICSDGLIDVAQLVQLRRIADEKTRWNSLIVGIEQDNQECFVDVKEFTVHSSNRIKQLLTDNEFEVDIYPDGYSTGDFLEYALETVVAK